MTTAIKFMTIRSAERAPQPFTMHGVALGPSGGVIVSARHGAGDPQVVDVRRFPPTLTEIGKAVDGILTDDPDCKVMVDSGLHGLDLWNHLGGRRHGLRLFEVLRPELRRYEIAGRLRSVYESRGFTVRRLLGGELRKAIADATREDAADRPEIVALSLAVVNRRNVPRIG